MKIGRGFGIVILTMMLSGCTTAEQQAYMNAVSFALASANPNLNSTYYGSGATGYGQAGTYRGSTYYGSGSSSSGGSSSVYHCPRSASACR